MYNTCAIHSYMYMYMYMYVHVTLCTHVEHKQWNVLFSQRKTEFKADIRVCVHVDLCVHVITIGTCSVVVGSVQCTPFSCYMLALQPWLQEECVSPFTVK